MSMNEMAPLFVYGERGNRGQKIPFGDCTIEIETPAEKFKSTNGVQTLFIREIGWRGFSSTDSILEGEYMSTSNLDPMYWNGDVLSQHDFTYKTHTLEYYHPTSEYNEPEAFSWRSVCSTETTHRDLELAFNFMGQKGVRNHCFKFRIKKKPTKENFYIGEPGDPKSQKSFGSCSIVIQKKSADAKTSEEVNRFLVRALAQTDPASQPKPLSRNFAVRVPNLSYELWQKKILGKPGFDYDRHLLYYMGLEEAKGDTTAYNAKWRPILAEPWQKDNNGTPWRTAINEMIAAGVRNRLFRFLIKEKQVTADTKPADDPVLEPVEPASDTASPSNTTPPDDAIPDDLLGWRIRILHPKFSSSDKSVFCTEIFSIREFATPNYMAIGAYLNPGRPMEYRDLSWDTWAQHTLKRIHRFYKNKHNLEYMDRESGDFFPLDPDSETAWRRFIADTVRLDSDDRLISFRISDKAQAVTPVATPNSASGRLNAPKGPDQGGSSDPGSGKKPSSAPNGQSSSSKPEKSSSAGVDKSFGAGKEFLFRNQSSGLKKPPGSNSQSSGNITSTGSKRRRSSSDKDDPKTGGAGGNKRPKVVDEADPGAAPGVDADAEPDYEQDAENNDAEDSNEIDTENAIAQVEADRASGGSRAQNHLPEPSTNHKQMENAKCPSEERNHPQFAIACPCAKNSPSQDLCDRFHRRKGPVLVLAPASLLGVWKAEFDALYSTGSLPLDMTTIVRHTNYVATTAEKDLFQRIGIEDQSRFIIVTSSESYENRVLNWEPWKTSRKRYSRVIRDEFHQNKGADTNNIRYMRDLPGSPYMWALSGTPFEKSPEDLEGYLSILRRRKRMDQDYAFWLEHFATEDQWELIKHAQQPEFKIIINDWNKLMNIDPEDNLLLLRDFLSHFGGVLRTFMIRRTTETRWFGRRITDIPDNDHSDVPIDMDPHYTDDMKWLRGGLEWELRQKARSRGADGKPSLDEWMKASYMLRLAATFPAIARFHRKTIATQHLPKDSDAWRFTGKELQKNGWYNEQKDSPYSAHYNQLAESSNKLKWLFEKHLGKRVGGDVQTPILPPGKDKAQDDERIIIFSSFPAVAYITYLWLKNTKNLKGVRLIHANTKPRQKIINEFQGVADENGTIMSSDDAPRILISTPALIGSGFTMTRAFRLVLLELA